jgi:hypothetical protein
MRHTSDLLQLLLVFGIPGVVSDQWCVNPVGAHRLPESRQKLLRVTPTERRKNMFQRGDLILDGVLSNGVDDQTVASQKSVQAALLEVAKDLGPRRQKLKPLPEQIRAGLNDDLLGVFRVFGMVGNLFLNFRLDGDGSGTRLATRSLRNHVGRMRKM